MSHPERPDLSNAVWLRRDAIADGITDKKIQRLVSSGAWHRLRRGAYCSGELWRELGREDRHRLLCRAVLRTAHPSAVLSHVSAAVERGLPVWGDDLSEVHTTRADGRSGRREAGVVQHHGVLPAEHVEILDGVPVTTAVRIVIEVSTVLGVEGALVVANAALHGGHASPDDLERLAHDTRYWPASLTTRLVLGLADAAIESPLESRVCYLIWREHLPRPETQVAVRDEQGRLVARLDFLWREAGVFLEADGREKYRRHRRPGQTLEDYLMLEKQREELVCLLTGWVCVRVGWRDLEAPARLGARLRRLLAARPQPA